jgi:hypothetical protein
MDRKTDEGESSGPARPDSAHRATGWRPRHRGDGRLTAMGRRLTAPDPEVTQWFGGAVTSTLYLAVRHIAVFTPMFVQFWGSRRREVCVWRARKLTGSMRLTH